jgi:hypothetical protein
MATCNIKATALIDLAANKSIIVKKDEEVLITAIKTIKDNTYVMIKTNTGQSYGWTLSHLLIIE